MNSKIIGIALAASAVAALASCSPSDKVSGPKTNARIEVSSDPADADIILDATNTGKKTPSTLFDVATNKKHEILVKLVKDNITYGYRVSGVQAIGDSLVKINGPLTVQCTATGTGCLPFTKRHTLGSLTVATVANGQLFKYNAEEQTGGSGLIYPAGSATNFYLAGGLPLIAGITNTANHDTVALGLYDANYLNGRPSPEVTQTAERYTMKQTFWVIPPSNAITLNTPTIRGIEVNEQLIGVTATNDVAFVKLTYKNITNNPTYQAVDPIVPAGGITYNWVYLGFALDPDIGASGDDMITYDPDHDMVYAYDMDFVENFSQGWVDRPALVGLRLMEAPADATMKVLNGWSLGTDFGGGDKSERTGWGILSGNFSVPPDFAGSQIGFAPTSPGDYRMSVSAGPITLAPGASASITVAIILAPPTPGTYTSGQFVDPGNPTVNDRKIAKVASGLIDKAKSLTVPQ
jgi:hypothetical protein